jgi:hypothetical protein
MKVTDGTKCQGDKELNIVLTIPLSLCVYARLLSNRYVFNST